MQLPEVKVTLRNVQKENDFLDYYIVPSNNALASDWIDALKQLLINKNPIEKNYCFLGFPYSQRTVKYLCDKLNDYIFTINNFNATDIWKNAGLEPYVIEEFFTEDTVRFSNHYPVLVGTKDTIHNTLGYRIKRNIMNNLHVHFERLQGTVWDLSPYYKLADNKTKFAIRQLNNICHELENKILSDRKVLLEPEWVRPSQITTFLHAPRYELTSEHRQGFIENGYDRELGGVYMHWTQIGKTFFEVWHDENAPDLEIGDDPTDIRVNDGTTSEAITSLRFYSGEFDIEWAKTIKYGQYKWHDEKMEEYYSWLLSFGIDKNNTNLSLGYLKVGQIDLLKSFGTLNEQEIWKNLENYLDVFAIEVDNIRCEYPSNWADEDADNQQIEFMKEGYDYSSSRG